jgi:PAS domain-containing protein
MQDEATMIFKTIAAGDELHHLESEIQRKDGMPVPISLSACPVTGASGENVAAIAIARDITEQRLAQATLAEIDARMRDGEALAHVGSWLWDVRTNTVQWSDEMHRVLRIEPLDFDGTFDGHVAPIHVDDREHVRGALLEAAHTGRGFEAEYRIERPGGEPRWVYARAAAALGSAGTVVGLRGICQDVTDRRAPDDGRANRARTGP